MVAICRGLVVFSVSILLVSCGKASADVPRGSDSCLPGPGSRGDVCQSESLEPRTECDCSVHSLAKVFAASGCPDSMVRVADFCIDRYEASVWSDGACDGSGLQYGASKTDDFPQTWPLNGQYSDPNDALYACSVPAVTPSGWVTYFRATAACAESGKRLCSNAQWQVAALGTPDSEMDCPVNVPGPVQTDAYAPTCQSRWGVVQMVGNMQEWTADWVVNGVAWYDAETQGSAGSAAVPAEWPASAGVDDRSRGVNGNALSGVSPNLSFTNGSPSVWLRSGSFGQGAHAGTLYLNGNVGPLTAFESGGFRCCAAPYTLPGSIAVSSSSP